MRRKIFILDFEVNCSFKSNRYPHCHRLSSSSRYCVSGHQSLRPAAHIWRGGDRCVQRSGHGRHGTSHLLCGRGSLPHHDQVRGRLADLSNFTQKKSQYEYFLYRTVLSQLHYMRFDSQSVCTGRRKTSRSSSVESLAQEKRSQPNSP